MGRGSLDAVARTVTKAGEPVALTPREFDLLEQLIRNRGAALYRDALFERVWGGEMGPDTRTLDLHINRLRKKLGWHDKITTVYKVGYKLEKEEAEALKFAQRLSCAVLLLLAGVFSLAGFVLVYINAADMLRQAAAQVEQWHRMQYYTLETQVLGMMARGEDVTDDACWRAPCALQILARTAAKAASGWKTRTA